MRHLYVKMICEDCSKTFSVPVYCGNRFCPVCSVRRNARVRARLNFLVDNCDRPRGYSFKHLTLTISNQPDLEGMTSEILKSFRKLRQRQFWKNNVDGGAFVLEVSGNPGNWHVHIHAILMSRFLPFERILKLWRSVSSGRGVYIQKIPPSAVVGYLTKYLTKSDVLEGVSFEMNSELRDKRLFNPFGTWFTLSRKFKLPRCKCQECGKSSFLPFDIIYGRPPTPFYADCNMPSVELDLVGDLSLN